MKSLYLLIGIALFVFQSCAERKTTNIDIKENYTGVIYVNINAKGENSGKSWQNAFNNLNDAIAFSNETDEIWIAEGVYYPKDNFGRSSSFFLKKNTKLYGGFGGWEQTLEQRNYKEHVTVLSGDIGVKGELSDNVYHVVRGNDDVILNGLTIENGYAIGDTRIENTPAKQNNYGGALYNNDVQMTVENVVFRNNHAMYGGAVYNSNYSNKSPIIFNNVKFENNSSKENGGALYNAFCKKLIILNSSFENNKSLKRGGAIYSAEYSYQIMENVIFTNNNSDFGGALFTQGNTGTVINSATLNHNLAKISGGAIFQEKSKDNYVELNGYNISKNKSLISPINIFTWDENVLLDDYIKRALNKKLAQTGYIENQNELYSDFDYTKYLYRLERLENSKSNKENKPHREINTLQKRVYVAVDNEVENQNGDSWETAFFSLQKALDYAKTYGIKEIWIKEGIYRPEGGREASYNLHDEIKLYGGFKGDETKLAQRSYYWHKTILSGNIGKRNLHSDNVYHVLKSSGNIYLDGLIIGWGNADNESGIKKGGALLASTSYGDRVVIKNTKFSSSYADYGGAVYIYGEGEVEFTNVDFEKNNANLSGGALVDRTDGKSIYVDCTFGENSSKQNGGAFYSDSGSKIELLNVDFRYNESGLYGGSLFLANFKEKQSVVSNLAESIISDSEAKAGSAITTASNYELKINKTYFFNNYSDDKKGYIRALDKSYIRTELITAENNY